MIRCCIISVLALVSHLGMLSYAHGESTAILEITVLEPVPPITTSDIVRIRAATVENVFRGSGGPAFSSSFVVDGFDIDWIITSSGFSGIGTPESKPMMYIDDLGPLPAGIYDVTVTWTHTGDGLLAGAPSSGIGSTTFSIVPEPLAWVLSLEAFFLVVCMARRR